MLDLPDHNDAERIVGDLFASVIECRQPFRAIVDYLGIVFAHLQKMCLITSIKINEVFFDLIVFVSDRFVVSHVAYLV